MKRISIACVAILFVVCVGLSDGIRAGADPHGPVAHHQGWEYASVGISPYDVYIVSPGKSASGKQWPEAIGKYTGTTPASAFPQDAIHALGADGWEMVGTESSDGRISWWFKRAKVQR